MWFEIFQNFQQWYGLEMLWSSVLIPFAMCWVSLFCVIVRPDGRFCMCYLLYFLLRIMADGVGKERFLVHLLSWLV